MHRLLVRQLRRILAIDNASDLSNVAAAIETGRIDNLMADPVLGPLLTRLPQMFNHVSSTYQQHERDMALLRNSLEISSRELSDANNKLRADSAAKTRALETLQRALSKLPDLRKAGSHGDVGDIDELAEKLVGLSNERESMQQALAESEERLKLALKGASDGVWDWNLTTNTVFYSPRWKAMIGYANEEIGNSLEEWEKRIHPDDLPAVQASFFAHLEGSTPQFETTYRFRHRDGHYLSVLARGLAVEGQRGKPYRVVGTHVDITERKALEDELRQYRDALDAHAIVSITDAAGVITYANERFFEISGYRRDELIGRTHRIIKSGLHPPEYYTEMWETISSGRVWEGEVCNRDKAGKLYWVLSTIVPFLDEDGLPYQYLSFRTVISELKRVQHLLAKEKDRAQVTLASIGDGVLVTDRHGHVTFLNDEAERITGWTRAEADGVSAAEVTLLLDEVSGEPLTLHPVLQCRFGNTPASSTLPALLLTPTHQQIPIEHTVSPILHSDGNLTGIVMILRDVSKARELSRKMSWQATHDPLTGLWSRAEFERRLDALIRTAKDPDATHALLYLDLDQFKVVNDTCGHAAGDELLKQVTFLLHKEIRHGDTLARLGGDEFGVLLSGCPLFKAAEIADRLRLTVHEFRFAWEERSFEIGVSIGLVVIDSHGGSASDALSHADMACYAAKDLGRNRIRVFEATDELLSRRQEEMHWATRINQALAQNRFRLYAQEIRPLGGDAAPHFEILLRMLSKSGEEIPPGAFIPAAERYGLMDKIDRWVISHALEALGHSGFHQGEVKFAINLSALSLMDESLGTFLRQQMHQNHVAPASLCLEITETAAISHLATAVKFINDIKSLGCRFSLDDFGSGMSSFAYLKNLPVDYIKIDGAFVRDIVSDPIDRTFVESIHRIGEAMGKETIAEFVENDRILQILTDIGVNYVQGYGVSRPLPLDDWLNTLKIDNLRPQAA
jgi:diguanylate cyclase (GGDEF)-like protein/PAS domain S-box-containing protein